MFLLVLNDTSVVLQMILTAQHTAILNRVEVHAHQPVLATQHVTSHVFKLVSVTRATYAAATNVSAKPSSA